MSSLNVKLESYLNEARQECRTLVFEQKHLTGKLIELKEENKAGLCNFKFKTILNF